MDPRDGKVEEEALAHEGSKGARAIYLKNGLVFTTGFTKHSERQYSLRAPGTANYLHYKSDSLLPRLHLAEDRFTSVMIGVNMVRDYYLQVTWTTRS